MKGAVLGALVVGFGIGLGTASVLMQNKVPEEVVRNEADVVVDTNEYFYPDGSIKLREMVDRDGWIVRSTWYLPDGRELWRSFAGTGKHTETTGIYVDNEGRIRRMFHYVDQMANGPAWIFDPPLEITNLEHHDGKPVERGTEYESVYLDK